MVEGGLLFTPEATRDGFLNLVRNAVVVVVGVLTVGHAVVVVVDVVVGRLAQALAQDTEVPHGLEVAVAISVQVVAVVVVVHTVCAAEEVRIQLAAVVVEVVVGVHFEEVPDAVVVVVHVKPIVDCVVIVVDVDRVVGEVAVGVAVHVVVVEVSTQLVGEVRFGTVVGLPLPKADEQTKPGDVGVAVVDDVRVRDAGFRSTVAAEVVEVAAALCTGRAADFGVGRRHDRALIDVGVGARGVWRTKLRVDAVERHVPSKGVSVAAHESVSELAHGVPASGHVDGTAHLDVVHVEDAVVAFVLVPPVGHAVTVLVGVEAVDQGVAVAVDVPLVAAVVAVPAGVVVPVELGDGARRGRVGGAVVAVVVDHHLGEGVVLVHHGPVVRGVVAVALAVQAAVEEAAVVDGVEGRLEVVVQVRVEHPAVAVVRVEDVGDAVVVVVPVHVVFKAVTVDVRVDGVDAVVAVQRTVDGVKIGVVVEVTVVVNVERIDDAVVVVVHVVPVADAVAVPVVELREGGAPDGALRVGVGRVGVRQGRAVPSGHFGGGVEREGVVFVGDAVVVGVVLDVRRTSGHQGVAKVVRARGAAHVGIEPIVDAVVVLVEGAEAVVVEVLVVVHLTIDGPVTVCVRSRDVEDEGAHGADVHGSAKVAAVDGDGVACSVTVTGIGDGDLRHRAADGHDVHGQSGTGATVRGGHAVRGLVVLSAVDGRAVECGDFAAALTGHVTDLVPVGVEVDACVKDAVVVVVGVDHVEDAVVVVVGVGAVGRSVIVVVRVEEVGDAVAVEVAVHDVGERGRAGVFPVGARLADGGEARGRGARAVDAVVLPLDVVHAAGVRAVLVEGPRTWRVEERRCG